MPFIDTLIIGAGQAGLAASRLLTEARHEHLVLERGRVGERWLSSTWDSLRLLTPNWMTRLPYWRYTGTQPHAYMTAAEVAGFLAAYGQAFDASILAHTVVHHLGSSGRGFEVTTSRGDWKANNVVIATGWSDLPAIPRLAARLDPSIVQLAPANYRNPTQLDDGAVLIVGASATGVQLADELARAGRRVYLAVGGHTRMPRRYRGKDIFWWLDRIGTLDRTVDELPSGAAARHEPSLQLVGRTDRSVDLTTLAASGVTLTGRLTGLDGPIATFADDLSATMLRADDRLQRVVTRIEAYIAAHDLGETVRPPEYITPSIPIDAPLRMDLRRAGVSTVIWATGHRRSYPWLHLPALDSNGELAHRYGVTPIPGLYVLGQRFQRTRRSNFLDGVGADAVAVTGHLLARKRVFQPSGIAA
jgi:putative flavoprotein involved in K+ transport